MAFTNHSAQFMHGPKDPGGKQPSNPPAQQLHGTGIRMVPHGTTSAYRSALLEQLQRDGIAGKGGQSTKQEKHNAQKKDHVPGGVLYDE
jgi:hypothetical protein